MQMGDSQPISGQCSGQRSAGSSKSEAVPESSAGSGTASRRTQDRGQPADFGAIFGTAQDSFIEIGGSPLRLRVHRNRLVPIFLLLAASLAVSGQNRPPEQMEVFRNVSEAMANRDADAFLDQFDRQMPQYEKLRDEIQELFGLAQEIGSTIDVITDEGDDSEADAGVGLAAEDRHRRTAEADREVPSGEAGQEVENHGPGAGGVLQKVAVYRASSMGRASGGSTRKLSSAMRATAARMEASVVG